MIKPRTSSVKSTMPLSCNIFTTILYQFDGIKLVSDNIPVLSIISFLVALNCSNVITNSNSLHFSIKTFTNIESIGIGRSA